MRDLEILKPHGIEPGDLLGASLENSQMIGRAVAWLGFGGLLVPSARHDSANLAVYWNRMEPADHLDVLEEEDYLPGT